LFSIKDNSIRKIEGLEYCQRLKNLNLAHNSITKIEGLDNLPLQNLDLVREKNISMLDYLKKVKKLCVFSEIK